MSELFPLFATRSAMHNATHATTLNATNTTTDPMRQLLENNGGLGLTPSEVPSPSYRPLARHVTLSFTRSSSYPSRGATWQVGTSLIALGLMLFVSPLLYPLVEARVGHVGCFTLGIACFTSACVCLPFLRVLRDVSPSAMWVGINAIGLMRGLGGPMCFSAVSVSLNDRIVDQPGLYNGLAMSASSLARAVSPTASGSLFALVTAHGAGRYPLDYRLPFHSLGGIGLFTLLLVRHVAGTGGPKRKRRSWRRWLTGR